MPFHVVGQHAHEQVRPHPPLLPVEHRAHRQQRLHRAEGALHARQALVGAHRLLVAQRLPLQAGPDHVDPVQARLLPDRLLLARRDECSRGLVELLPQVLAHAPPPPRAEAPVELVPVVVAGRQPGGLGQLQQQVALAPPLGGDHRIEAHQQALAGEIVARDAGQAPGVEQPGLDDLLAGELVDGVVAQGGDPVEAGRLEILVDAGLGDHAPVADQGDADQSEALAQRGHLVGDRVGVGGVAGEGLHGDRAAITIAQQAVHDLRSVGAVVAGVAVRGELALDGGLALGEPVHGLVEIVGGGVGDVEEGGEGGAAGGAELALDAQLGAGLEQAAGDHGKGEGAVAVGLVEEQAVELEALGGAEEAAGAEGECGAVGTDSDPVNMYDYVQGYARADFPLESAVERRWVATYLFENREVVLYGSQRSIHPSTVTRWCKLGLGIDLATELQGPQGRLIHIVDPGVEPIQELFV